MILKISEEFIDNNKVKSFIGIDKKGFEKIYNSSDRFGARGILYLAIFKYLYNRNTSAFRKIISEEMQNKILCHYVRMGLALSYNLSNYTKPTRDTNSKIKDEEKFIFSTIRFSASQLCQKLKFWYNDTKIFNIIQTLLNIADNNFEKFAIIFPTQYHNEYSFLSLIENNLQKWIENNDFTNLGNLEIKLLSASVIYCENVFIHYEYCNLIRYLKLYASTENFIYDIKTVFQILQNCENKDERLVKESFNNISQQFQEVYNVSRDIINAADNYFCQKYKDNGFNNCSNCNNISKNCSEAIDNFKKEGFTINETLFVSRLITSHISYLDDFRKFIFNSDILTNSNIDKEWSKSKFNKLTLDYIKNYIDLYNSLGRKDIPSTMKRYEENYCKAISNFNTYTQIATSK